MFTVSKLVSRGWVPQFSTRRAGHYNAQMCFHAAMIKKKDHGLMTIMRTPRTPPLQYPLDQLHHDISYLYAFPSAQRLVSKPIHGTDPFTDTWLGLFRGLWYRGASGHAAFVGWSRVRLEIMGFERAECWVDGGMLLE
jgi:hypothetical protein